MSTIWYEGGADDAERRARLYQGHLVLYAPRPSSLRFCEFAREMIAEAFGGMDPLTAQARLPVARYVEILAALKPAFIHHPRSKAFIQELLRDLGCDLARTYFDVPRMRTATSDNYLTSGIAYAFHPHRDTWYSAPFSQINFWMPIYDIVAENALAFHPYYWDHPVRNGSREYDYARWVRESRQTAAQHVTNDTRKQPRPEEPIALDPQVRPLVPAGGIIIFSGAQLHSTVPNTSGVTRFSIDFRTVHLDDVAADRGARNIDSECTGTTMGDYLRGTDLAQLPADLVERYENTPARPVAAGAGA
ncbi:MAG: phytanoyl-CoA dioxygenase family protein [Candidatus Rokubacteria bacterium]|nr:phytanoyl-CoA dioxygenase family protein [Candidatus Rokubacteria bacterium]